MMAPQRRGTTTCNRVGWKEMGDSGSSRPYPKSFGWRTTIEACATMANTSDTNYGDIDIGDYSLFELAATN